LLFTRHRCFSQGTGNEGLSIYGDKDEFYRDTVWIITGKRGLGPLFKKWKFDFVLDARRTFISNVPAQVIGIRMGAEYRRVHRFGVGIYALGSDVHVSSFKNFDIPFKEAVVRLSYASLFYERVLYFHRKWEWSSAFHIASGEVTGSYLPLNESEWSPLPVTKVRAMELSTIGYYNLTWWCNIGVGVGYRQMSGLQPELRRFYSAPVAIARVRIRLGKLVQSIWDRDKKYEY